MVVGLQQCTSAQSAPYSVWDGPWHGGAGARTFKMKGVWTVWANRSHLFGIGTPTPIETSWLFGRSGMGTEHTNTWANLGVFSVCWCCFGQITVFLGHREWIRCAQGYLSRIHISDNLSMGLVSCGGMAVKTLSGRSRHTGGRRGYFSILLWCCSLAAAKGTHAILFLHFALLPSLCSSLSLSNCNRALLCQQTPLTKELLLLPPWIHWDLI